MQIDPIELSDRLGRWAVGRGPIPTLLAARLRRLIDDGDLEPGARLPTDRALSATLAVGRSTVVAAYEQLVAEGRIVRRQGSGTQVAGDPRHRRPAVPTSAPVFLHLLAPIDGTLMMGCAAPSRPPHEVIDAASEATQALAGLDDDIGYHPAGLELLRERIAARHTARGLPTTSNQIVVTNGGQQALTLLARLYGTPGSNVLVEAPTYPGAIEAFREQALSLQTLPVGLTGFEAEVRNRAAAFAYVVPACHNPTGTSLTLMQRESLTAQAARAEVPLIEDEVLADLDFTGHAEHTAGSPGSIVVGSLSKLVWGGLRIGWIRAPEPAASRLARLRAVSDLGGAMHAQLIAVALLPQLDSIRRWRVVELQHNHDHLRAELARALPDWDCPPATGGQTLWVRLPAGDAASFAQAALRAGVAVLPGSGLDASGGSSDRLRIPFVAAPAQLTEATRRLAAAWQGYRPAEAPRRGLPVMAV